MNNVNVEIRNRLSEVVIYSAEVPVDTSKHLRMRSALESAVKIGAKLAGADLVGADLAGANLDGIMESEMSEKTWSCETEGSICLFDSIAEAVDDYLCYADYSEDDVVSVHRYVSVPPTPHDCGSPLEYILERLDEEYLADEATPDSPTQTMRDAEKEFIETVLSEYNCQSLRCVETRIVNLREFFERRDQ